VNTVTYPHERPERLDKFLADTLPGSREFWKERIRAGAVTVNGKIAAPSLKLHRDDRVAVDATCENVPGVAWPAPEAGDLRILHEDTQLLVLDKPPGIITHPTVVQSTGTLVNRILAHTGLSSIGLPYRPGVVHRLDRDTTGCIVFTKTDEAYYDLVDQFKSRQVSKTYFAIAEGRFPAGMSEISVPMAASHRRSAQKMGVRFSGGKHAITEVKVLSSTTRASYLEVHPVTGRTHQIRLSLAFVGHPVVGDVQYGRESGYIGRQALHAGVLSFRHPASCETVTFHAELPEDMQFVLAKLSLSS
jgi:23S rRNA pseudouridine1911/1915/1917 synthase